MHKKTAAEQRVDQWVMSHGVLISDALATMDVLEGSTALFMDMRAC